MADREAADQLPAAPGGFAGPGGIIGGQSGWLRMFDDANGGQIGWMLAFAVGAGAIALWHWRRDPVRRAAVVLFLGWTALYGGVFSYAEGIFHSYYTSAMAPAVSALVGIGVVGVADAVRRDRRWLAALVPLVLGSVWVELKIADRTPGLLRLDAAGDDPGACSAALPSSRFRPRADGRCSAGLRP